MGPPGDSLANISTSVEHSNSILESIDTHIKVGLWLKEEIAKTIKEVVVQESQLTKDYQGKLSKVLDLDGGAVRAVDHYIFRSSLKSALMGDAISSELSVFLHNKDFIQATSTMILIQQDVSGKLTNTQ